jgi:hypothetical protein
LVTIKDEDLRKDDHVGSGNFSITDIMNKPEQIIQVGIQHKGKSAGTVQLKVKFSPD